MAFKMRPTPYKTKGHGMDSADDAHYHVGNKIVKKKDIGTSKKLYKAYETLDVKKQKNK